MPPYLFPRFSLTVDRVDSARIGADQEAPRARQEGPRARQEGLELAWNVSAAHIVVTKSPWICGPADLLQLIQPSPADGDDGATRPRCLRKCAVLSVSHTSAGPDGCPGRGAHGTSPPKALVTVSCNALPLLSALFPCDDRVSFVVIGFHDVPCAKPADDHFGGMVCSSGLGVADCCACVCVCGRGISTRDGFRPLPASLRCSSTLVIFVVDD